MSTQDSNGVDFSLLSDESQQHFRLLELPPELLELLTSHDPPTLQFKSSTKSDNEGAVICTSDKTYNVRQVNTSNSVYVCQAYQPSGNEDGSYRQLGLQGVAQTTFTLELEPAKNASAASYLRSALPTYSSTGTFQAKDAKSKQKYFDDIPLSQAECEESWRELACFETRDPPGCFIPSATAKLQAWRSILQLADASSVDLTAPIPHKQVTLMLHESEEWPPELSLAVLNSFSATGDDSVVIDAQRCVQATGETVLAAMSEGRPIARDSFLHALRDALPEQWRANAALEVLPKDRYAMSDDGKDVSFVGYGSGDAAAAPAATEAKSALGAKRKWHEKFRASKKTA